jgi:DNA-binding response OmpR family regulator
MGNKKILIVDDDPDIRHGMQLRLGYGGYATCFAADAAAGAAAANKEEPDLIVLDLGLPAGDGFIVIEQLKMHPVLGAVPIVVVSARDARANRERAIKAGATAYLQKPVDNAEFLAVIRQALGESQMDDLDKKARLLGKLAAIRENFLNRTRGELPLLRELLERIQEGDPAGFVQLRIFAHRLHGTGATFDFVAISESAGQIERLLDALVDATAGATVEPQDLARLLEFGRWLARDIGAATTQESAVDS